MPTDTCRTPPVPLHKDKRVPLRLAPPTMNRTNPTLGAPLSRFSHLHQRRMNCSCKRSTTATTIRQRGRLSRGELVSRRMRCSGFALRRPYQPYLPLVRRGGVLTRCFGLCVVRSAAQRVPPGLVHDRFGIRSGQQFHGNFVLVLYIFLASISTSCAHPTHALLI